MCTNTEFFSYLPHSFKNREIFFFIFSRNSKDNTGTYHLPHAKRNLSLAYFLRSEASGLLVPKGRGTAWSWLISVYHLLLLLWWERCLLPSCTLGFNPKLPQVQNAVCSSCFWVWHIIAARWGWCFWEHMETLAQHLSPQWTSLCKVCHERRTQHLGALVWGKSLAVSTLSLTLT